MVAIAIDAFEAGMRLCEVGDVKQGKQTAEEAMVYMLRGASQLGSASKSHLSALQFIGRN